MKVVKKMKAVKIKDDIFWIGTNDFETPLFEGLWPIDQEGVSYNAYVINDEKVAVIDAVKSIKEDDYLEKLQSIIGDKEVDYLIVNHMEPDHSSGMVQLIEKYPNMQIVGNRKTLPMMKNFYNIDNNFYEVCDEGTLSLGKHTLQFFVTPMVHWPESMVTYVQEEKILFSMDIFGSYKAPVGSIFDDQNNLDDFDMPIRRYFATIVGKVANQAARALKRLGGLEIQTICPSHGLIWRDKPGHILDLYTKMSTKETDPGVVIAYGTMYGFTRDIAERFAIALKENGVKTVKLYDVAKTDISFIVADIWKYKGLFLGAPSYYGQVFPKMANLLYKLGEIKVDNHKVGFFGNYSWSGGADKSFKAFADETKADLIDEILMIKGRPDAEEAEKIEAYAKLMADQAR